MSNQAQVQQVSVNPVAVISAVITALGAMTITAANKSNEVLSNTGDILVYGTSAGARVTKAVDLRAEIYGNAIVANGEIAEREHLVKARMRLASLEDQEAQMLSQTKPARKTRGPAKSKKIKTKPGKPVITRK